MEIEWYKYMKEGVNNKMKGETNACPKHGDTPVKPGDTQGVGSRLQIVLLGSP